MDADRLRYNDPCTEYLPTEVRENIFDNAKVAIIGLMSKLTVYRTSLYRSWRIRLPVRNFADSDFVSTFTTDNLKTSNNHEYS